MAFERRTLGLAGGLILIAIGISSHAWGIGVPTSQPLTYSGLLEYETGKAVPGPRNIEIKLWEQNGAEALCATGSDEREVVNGKFSVLLPDKCTVAVREHPDVWVEVLVDGAALERSKLGAVPYALEAANALQAVNAAKAAVASEAEGSLRTELDGLTRRVQALDCPNREAPEKYGFCIWNEDDGRLYAHTYAQAAALCRRFNARLCTLAEVSAAQAAGAQWCAWGWVADRVDDANAYRAFPMQETVSGCGSTGLVMQSVPMTGVFNANCCR